MNWFIKRALHEKLPSPRSTRPYAEPGAPSDDENAYRLLYKKTRGHLSDESRQLAGLYRFLAAKGFSAASAEYAVRKIKEEGEDTNEGLL